MNTPPHSPPPVITIDGPAASGKGTVAMLLAQRLGFHLLDSGALYRAVALIAQRDSIALDDEPALVAITQQMNLCFVPGDEGAVLLDGQQVGEQLRTEQCAAEASRIAKLESLRAALLCNQRRFQQPPGLVADGRDMGSVVFTDAYLKIFLDADVAVRAERRFYQMRAAGGDCTLAAVQDNLAQRDVQDRQRAISPLLPTADAQIIDTSNLSIDQVVDRIFLLAQPALR